MITQHAIGDLCCALNFLSCVFRENLKNCFWELLQHVIIYFPFNFFFLLFFFALGYRTIHLLKSLRLNQVRQWYTTRGSLVSEGPFKSIFIKRIKFQFTVSICFSWHLFLRLGCFVCITGTNKWPCFKSAHSVVFGLFSWGFELQLIPYRS